MIISVRDRFRQVKPPEFDMERTMERTVSAHVFARPKPPPPPHRLLRWMRGAARFTALVLPFDKAGVGRDLVRAAWRGGVTDTRRLMRSFLTPPPGAYMAVSSPKHQCIWIRISKVASKSIQAAMLEADPDCEFFYGGYTELYELRPEAREWFHFTFIRHPFDRALSFWFEIHFAHENDVSPWAHIQKRKKSRLLEICHGLAETRDFDAYCRWLHTPYAADDHADGHVASQSRPIRVAARSRNRPLDFMGRLENIDADWSRVAARTGIPIPKLPLMHSAIGREAAPEESVKAARAARAELLTELNKALLAARYAGDLELGGYSPKDLGAVE